MRQTLQTTFLAIFYLVCFVGGCYGGYKVTSYLLSAPSGYNYGMPSKTDEATQIRFEDQMRQTTLQLEEEVAQNQRCVHNSLYCH